MNINTSKITNQIESKININPNIENNSTNYSRIQRDDNDLNVSNVNKRDSGLKTKKNNFVNDDL